MKFISFSNIIYSCFTISKVYVTTKAIYNLKIKQFNHKTRFFPIPFEFDPPRKKKTIHFLLHTSIHLHTHLLLEITIFMSFFTQTHNKKKNAYNNNKNKGNRCISRGHLNLITICLHQFRNKHVVTYKNKQ